MYSFQLFENNLLMLVYLVGLFGIFGFADLCVWVHQKFFSKHTDVSYWSAYKRNI